MGVMENRYIRIEDWKGNVYFPESSSSSSTAGIIIDASSASTDPSSSIYTDGEQVLDPTANGGVALFLASTTEPKTLLSASISRIPFGDVIINIRIKSSMSEGTVPLLRMNTYYVDASGETPVETLLSAVNFNGNSFEVVNEYVNVGATINYKGIATGSELFKVELIVLPDTGASFYFDKLCVGMEMRASGASSTYVDHRTIVIDEETSGVHVEDRTVIVDKR